MRTEAHTPTHQNPDSNRESAGLDRAGAQYESLCRLVSDPVAGTRPGGDFEEVACKLAPAVRRRRLLA